MELGHLLQHSELLRSVILHSTDQLGITSTTINGGSEGVNLELDLKLELLTVGHSGENTFQSRNSNQVISGNWQL